MMTFILTVLLTFGLVSIALVFFWKLGSPVYRVERANVITLLEMVLAGEATESDWHVFAAYGIRHDPELGEIQDRCLELAENEFVGGKGLLFSSRGLRELEQILEELKAMTEEEIHG